MNTIADPKFNGTLERRIALVLDHNFIGLGEGRDYRLNTDSMDALVLKLAEAVRSHIVGEEQDKAALAKFKTLPIELQNAIIEHRRASVDGSYLTLLADVLSQRGYTEQLESPSFRAGSGIRGFTLRSPIYGDTVTVESGSFMGTFTQIAFSK